MHSAFSSTLAKLDDTLEVVLHQLEFLVACQEVNEEELAESLKNACHQGALLRDLIVAEDAQAEWNDRPGLDQLLAEIEAAAKAKRNQQLQSRLRELASELDAGTIKHRFEARTKALDALRVNAARELRAEAALPEETKELPGPGAGNWLNWACNLDDEQDAAVLTGLRRDFPALERFTGEMDVAYWVPGERAPESPDPAPPPPPRVSSPTATTARATAAVPSKPVGSVRSKQHNDTGNVAEQVHTAMKNGNYAEALSLCYPPASGSAVATADGDAEHETTTAAPAISSSVATSPSSTEPVTYEKYCDSCGRRFSARFGFCPFDDSALRVIGDESAQEMPGDNVATGEGNALEGSTLEQQPTSQAPKDLASFDGLAPQKMPVRVWAGAAALIVVGVLVAVVYHVHAGSAANSLQPGSSTTGQASGANQNTIMQSASAASAGEAGSVPLLHKRPVEGVQQKVLLSLELCNHVNAGGIECWGYVSNMGNDNSHISLDHADVVDGKGNNFTVTKKVPSTFPTGTAFDVPAGSRVKYSFNVPDKDRDARSLTVYVDLSAPPSLEYTFRDVPIVNVAN